VAEHPNHLCRVEQHAGIDGGVGQLQFHADILISGYHYVKGRAGAVAGIADGPAADIADGPRRRASLTGRVAIRQD
jgi:hypothetical protein